VAGHVAAVALDRHGRSNTQAGLARDALYLLRPDTYVGLADETDSADVLEAICAEARWRIEAHGR
jgi:hypothetical protein